MSPLTPTEFTGWLNVIARLVDLGITTWEKVREVARDEGMDEVILADLDRLYAERIARREKEASG